MVQESKWALQTGGQASRDQGKWHSAFTRHPALDLLPRFQSWGRRSDRNVLLGISSAGSAALLRLLGPAWIRPLTWAGQACIATGS